MFVYLFKPRVKTSHVLCPKNISINIRGSSASKWAYVRICPATPSADRQSRTSRTIGTRRTSRTNRTLLHLPVCPPACVISNNSPLLASRPLRPRLSLVASAFFLLVGYWAVGGGWWRWTLSGGYLNLCCAHFYELSAIRHKCQHTQRAQRARNLPYLQPPISSSRPIATLFPAPTTHHPPSAATNRLPPLLPTRISRFLHIALDHVTAHLLCCC